MNDEPTEWRTWGIYAVSKEGYMTIASVIPSGKPIGTYLVPRTVGSIVPRYRLTQKGIPVTHKISELLKKIWGIKRLVTNKEAEEMRKNAHRWNEARRALREAQEPIRRPRLARSRRADIDFMDELGSEDPFMSPSHPQYDPFSNWR